MIVALTPNPAIDRRLRLERPLRPGELNRARLEHEAAGGKGTNLARVVRALGGEVVVAGFLAGAAGERFRRMLAAQGLAGVFLEVPGETRECHILLDGHPQPTEVNEAGPTVSPADWDRLLERLPPGRLVVSGSLPPGTELAAFGAFLGRLPSPPVVDASGAALRAALEAGVALVKPNQPELEALTGVTGAGLPEARALRARQGTTVLLTLGPDGAALVSGETLFASAPPVEARDPIGAGDSLLGAYLWARETGCPEPEALRLGVAAGAESTRRGGPAHLTRSGVLELYERVRVERPA